VLVTSAGVDEPGAAPDSGDAQAASDWPDLPGQSGSDSSQAPGTLQGTDQEAESASS
jgi:hypothetical protein